MGNDLIVGGQGNDLLTGGLGNDTYQHATNAVYGATALGIGKLRRKFRQMLPLIAKYPKM